MSVLVRQERESVAVPDNGGLQAVVKTATLRAVDWAHSFGTLGCP